MKVYFSESFAAANVSFLNKFCRRTTERAERTDHVLCVMSDTRHRRELAIEKIVQIQCRTMMKDKPLLLIVENLQDPWKSGNDCANGRGCRRAQAVIVSPNTRGYLQSKDHPLHNGFCLWVPFFYAKDFAQQLADLKQAGVRLYAAHLDGNCEYTQPDYTGASAFLIGNEANGLTKASSDAADVLVRIPMQGQVESFNAAVAVYDSYI